MGYRSARRALLCLYLNALLIPIMQDETFAICDQAIGCLLGNQSTASEANHTLCVTKTARDTTWKL